VFPLLAALAKFIGSYLAVLALARYTLVDVMSQVSFRSSAKVKSIFDVETQHVRPCQLHHPPMRLCTNPMALKKRVQLRVTVDQ
jgi:hypothetical protein